MVSRHLKSRSTWASGSWPRPGTRRRSRRSWATAHAIDGLYARAAFDPSGVELAPGNRIDIDLTIPAGRKGERIEVFDRYGRRPNLLAQLAVADAAPRPAC